ncbi:hypothetical protein HX871_14535 [Pseudomonas reactans]|uniref:Uncharacterized protein n=1 Tax=Pseudomonas reactans TaxID=117680 RepID=A0ABX2QXQ7_9PSED|nr:hypothetical protein [Pseudomonas reactans]NWA38791.1 hypothetical protein [Pseudomonas reactans]NWC89767.1 hypothetical protein [Pseudomonas reactans]NWD32146.1 hypothetical protein [Pseudomonas reactans]NWD95644.1 hypothetical protein [Pseudomonas reactans]NWF14887.1 hypothetical protein [Pseudomonas reactans]
MKNFSPKAKPLLVAGFSAEAKKLGGSISANQRRFFNVAATKGKEMEPLGVLAGARC